MMKSFLRVPMPRLFYGWWVVLALVLIAYYTEATTYYGFGLFFNPIRGEFGWTAATTALAFSLSRLVAAVGAAPVGYFVYRFGPRALLLTGSVAVGLGFLLLSRIDSLLGFYASFLIVSAAFSFSMGPAVRTVTVVNWFIRKRGKALGLLAVGAGLTGTLAPLLAWLIQHHGWRGALVIVGVGTWIICLPLSVVVRHRPEKYGLLPDGDPAPLSASRQGREATQAPEVEGVHWRQALANVRIFWVLGTSGLLSGVALGSVVLLLVPHLESLGVPRGQAALAITLLTVSSLAGRLGLGWLGDLVDRRYLLALTVFLQAVGLVILAFVSSFWMVVPFLMVFGPAYGSGIVLRPALLAQYFGRRYFGTIQGLQQAVTAGGGIVGPYLAAWIFDHEGSYQKAWLLFAVLATLAAALILVAPAPDSLADAKGPGAAPPIDRDTKA